jgi:hypothetical protein
MLSAGVAFAALAMTATASVAQTVVQEEDTVRQAENTPPANNWVIFTRAGTPPTAAAFVTGPATTPLGVGSLQLTTTTGAEKVFAFNFDHIGTKLSDLGELSYSTYRSAGSFQQVAALNLVIDFNGPDVAGGFSTLVFEPVYNTDQGAVVSGEWQDWIASGSGVWWSTRAINGQCAGATSTCDKTWSEILANNPDAVVLGGFGVNQGSGNPGLVTAVDALKIAGVTYDFEPTITPQSKDDCKNGGFQNSNRPTFDNQGQCVSFVNGRGKNK